jgi:integrase/recombinase XerD
LGQRRLRMVEGAGGLVGAEAVGRSDDGPARCAPDPGVFEQECIDAFVASQVAQGFSQITIDNGTGVLERFLALAAKPVWEITEHDVDRVIAALVKRGVTQTTRRGYVQAFRGFFGFLEARKAVEIEALFGCRLRDPLDRFNSPARVLRDAGAGAAADGRAGRRVL